MMSRTTFSKLGLSLATAMTLLLASSTTVHAQERGFQLNRYEPTMAGEFSFYVDHPWYSNTRYFAAGFTLNYAHDPLVLVLRNANGDKISEERLIQHQFLGHLDLAGSFLDRLSVHFSVPFTFVEQGREALGVKPSGTAVGDPRIGFNLRLFGQPYSSPFSLSLGATIWVPIGSNNDQAGDQRMRFLPKLMAGGLSHHVMWSFTFGFLYRKEQTIGSLPAGNGNQAGSEVQFGGAIAYADMEKRFSVGPEVVVSSIVTGGHAFRQSFTSLEALLGFNYNIARWVQIGVAGGVGALRTPGTPDGRVLFRIAFAPMPGPTKAKEIAAPPSDRDQDGILDADDACPDDKGPKTLDPKTNGCPDRDNDTVIDKLDQCPDLAQGQFPDKTRLGCPTPDTDADGVLDPDDQCPFEPMGANPDPTKPGCPAKDQDGDLVWDHDDKCPTEPAGPKPDPARPGCPAPDRDKDTIPDHLDACPDKPGAPSADPKKNGCPGLVEMRNGKIAILTPVFFATGKDVILPKSFPVLAAVADALKGQPEIKKIEVQGHTDNVGKPAKNVDLSQRRASSVLKYLVSQGVDTTRLTAKGYGQDRPIEPNTTEKGRSVNRRVEFVILEAPGVKVQIPVESMVPPQPPEPTKPSKPTKPEKPGKLPKKSTKGSK